MQYTYEESVRELSDFLGKHVTADNYWKMEQVLLTILGGDPEKLREEFESGQEDCECLGASDSALDEAYEEGYENGQEEARSDRDQYFQDGYDKGYEEGYQAGREDPKNY